MGQCSNISNMSDVQREHFSNHRDDYIGATMTIKVQGITENSKCVWPQFVRLRPDKPGYRCALQDL